MCAPYAMQLWHVHSQDLSHSLHILSFSVPRGCCHPGSTPESLDADAPKATGSKTLFMAVLGSVGLFVTVVHYGFSMIHILVKGKWNATVWSRLLLGSSVVDLAYLSRVSLFLQICLMICSGPGIQVKKIVSLDTSSV